MKFVISVVVVIFITLSNEASGCCLLQKYSNLEIFGKKGKDQAKPAVEERSQVQLDGTGSKKVAAWASTATGQTSTPTSGTQSTPAKSCLNLKEAEDKAKGFVASLNQDQYNKLAGETKQLVDQGCLEPTTEQADVVGSYAATKYKVKDDAGKELGSVVLPKQPAAAQGGGDATGQSPAGAAPTGP